MGRGDFPGFAETADHLDGAGMFRMFAAIVRLHITVIAALGLFTFGWLFTGRYPWVLTGVCALDWTIVNLLNRVVDLREDRINVIRGTRFVNEHRGTLLVLACGVLGISLVLVHLVNPHITALRVAYHLLGGAYNWRVLPGGRRLKDLYFWKNTASAAGFIITLFGYPLATARLGAAPSPFPPGITWVSVLLSALFFFLFELSYEVIYDLRDVKGDALAGIRTYPAVHGVRTAVRIVDGLILSSMGVLLLGHVLGRLPWRIFIMIIPPAILFGLYKRAIRRGGVTAEDCIRFTWLGSALIVLYHLWVVLGLPGTGF